MVFISPPISLARLLTQCEEQIACDKYQEWELEQAVNALEEMHKTITDTPGCFGTGCDEMGMYKRRINYLRSVAPRTVGLFDSPTTTRVSRQHEMSTGHITPPPPASTSLSSTDDVTAVVSRPVTSASDVISDVSSSQLRLRRHNVHLLAERQQLLSPTTTTAVPQHHENNSGRGGGGAKGSNAGDFEQQITAHRHQQQHHMHEMLELTRSLKQHSLLAKRVIARDNETLERSNTQASCNQTHLHEESIRLSEARSRSCRCWLWVMMALVSLTFLGMVVFIRVF